MINGFNKGRESMDMQSIKWKFPWGLANALDVFSKLCYAEPIILSTLLVLNIEQNDLRLDVNGGTRSFFQIISNF